MSSGNIHRGDTPGWLVEGVADYVRWFLYEPQSHGADMVWFRRQGKDFSPHYNAGYRVTPSFPDWVAATYDANIVTEVNAAAREGRYTEDFWQQRTGETVQELGAQWRRAIETQLHPPVATAPPVG